jgi:hypothetical protein
VPFVPTGVGKRKVRTAGMNAGRFTLCRWGHRTGASLFVKGPVRAAE